MDNFRSNSLVSKYAQAGIDPLTLAIKAAQVKSSQFNKFRIFNLKICCLKGKKNL